MKSKINDDYFSGPVFFLFFIVVDCAQLQCFFSALEKRSIVADTKWNNRTNFQQKTKGGIKEDRSDSGGMKGNSGSWRREGGGVAGDEGQLGIGNIASGQFMFSPRGTEGNWEDEEVSQTRRDRIPYLGHFI